MNKGLSSLKVILIIGFTYIMWNISNFFRENSTSTEKKIAVACVTDLHCNDQIYPKIGVRVKELCETNDEVILVVNGDIFTKYNPMYTATIDNIGMGEDLYAFHENHFLSPGGLADFFINLMGDNLKIGVVFNIGNHEVMFEYAHLLARFFKKIRDRVGERFQVVSNLKAKKPDVPMGYGEPRDGLVEFIKPSARLGQIIFVGYCTTRIFKNAFFKGKSLYGYGRDHFYGVEKTTEAHDQVFIDNIRNAVKNKMDSSVLFLLAHEGTRTFSDVWKKVEKDSQNKGNYLSTMEQRIIVTGHAHGQRNDDCGGMDEMVIVPGVFGQRIEVVELSFLPMWGNLKKISRKKNS
ncbi:MAG: hypothetical protein LBI77_00825 [Puniceicoccales bacterium]|jgi:hypothetical protein|nr:hypothetical protein [Puniceicoccales bacterium]